MLGKQFNLKNKKILLNLQYKIHYFYHQIEQGEKFNEFFHRKHGKN